MTPEEHRIYIDGLKAVEGARKERDRLRTELVATKKLLQRLLFEIESKPIIVELNPDDYDYPNETNQKPK